MSRFKIISSTCITHRDEHVTAFCKIHCKTLCLKCVLKDHAKCVANQCVDEVKATIGESERGLPNMISSSEHLTVVLNDCRDKNEANLANLEKSEEAMNAGIVKLKTILIDQIERLSSDSLEMVKSVVTEQRRVLQHDRDVIGGFMQDLDEIKTFNDEVTSGQSVRIGKVKAMMESFTVLETQFNARDRGGDRHMKFAFKISDEVDYVRKHLLSFGELCFHDSTESNVNDHVVQSNETTQLNSNASAKESEDFGFMLPSAHSENRLNDGYVGLEYDTLPPPLPSSHPPVGSILDVIHEKHEHIPHVESMPSPLSFEHADDGRRPVTISSPLDASDQRKLSMPALPKRRHSHQKHPRSFIAETDGEKTGSTSTLNQSTDSFSFVKSSLESITKSADNVDGRADTSYKSSTASLHDSVFNLRSRSTAGDGLDKSQNEHPSVRWQTASFSSTESQNLDILDNLTPPKSHTTDSQSQDKFDYTKLNPPKSHKTKSQSHEKLDYMTLKPPKSHTFMWSSSSGGTTTNSVRDSGIHVSNTDISRTPNQSPNSSKKDLSDFDKPMDGTGMSIAVQERLKNFETIKDSDEPLKSLSHSDLPNLQELQFQKRLSRTASDKSINWDKYGEEKDEIEFQKPMSSSQNSSHSDINYSRIGAGSSEDSTDSDMHLHNMKISGNSEATKRTTLHQHTDSTSSQGLGSAWTLSKPCVVKETRSDQSRNFKLPDVKETTGHFGRSHHCTLTGIAITGAGHLLVCDFENHSVQHFNSSGVLVSDCSVSEPFSCCLMKDELVAVTSKSRQSLSIFELSETTMSLRKEHKVGLVTDVYGVGYSDGFFAVCCRDQVTILTDDLQPYCEVKPLMITHKKRSKPYFTDVRYVVMETRIKLFLYASEHNVNRITSLSLDKTFKYHKEWDCRVAKPRSLLIADDCLLVAAKGKIVVLNCGNGERMREIQTDVPSHPVHMVLHNHWLYMSKSSTSNSESRMLRKIRLAN